MYAFLAFTSTLALLVKGALCGRAAQTQGEPTETGFKPGEETEEV